MSAKEITLVLVLVIRVSEACIVQHIITASHRLWKTMHAFGCVQLANGSIFSIGRGASGHERPEPPDTNGLSRTSHRLSHMSEDDIVVDRPDVRARKDE